MSTDIERAKEAFTARRFDEVVAICAAALSTCQADQREELIELSTRARFEHKEYAEAATDLVAQIRANPGNYNIYLLYAEALRLDEKYADIVREMGDLCTRKDAPAQVRYDAYVARANAFEQIGNVRDALGDLDNAVDLDDANPRAIRLRAKLYLRNEIPKKAAEDARRLLALEPDDEDNVALLGTALGQAGNIKEAITLFEDDRWTNSRHIQHDLGVLKIRAGEYADAKRVFERYASFADNNDAAHHLIEIAAKTEDSAEVNRLLEQFLANETDVGRIISLGNMVGNAGNESGAIRCYDHVLTLSPGNRAALFERAISLNRLDRPKEALNTIDDLLRLSPQDINALLNKGDILLALHRRDDASTIADDPRVSSSNNEKHKLHRSMLLRRLSRHREAIEILTSLLENGYRRFKVQVELGETYAAMGDSERALAAFRDADANNANDTHVLAHIGVCLLDSDKASDSIEVFDHILLLEPSNLTAISNKGLALLKIEQYEDATATFSRGLEIDKTISFLHLGKAISLIRQNDYVRAADALNVAISEIPRVAYLYSTRAYVKSRLGLTDQAISDVSQALDIDPGDGANFYNRAILMSEAGKEGDAVNDYRAAMVRGHDKRKCILGLLKSFLILKRYDEARATGWDAIEDLKDDYIFWYLMGVTLSRLSETYRDVYFARDAITNFNNGIRCLHEMNHTKSRDDIESLFLLERAFAFSTVHERRSAIADYRKVINITWLQDKKYRISEINLERLAHHANSTATIPRFVPHLVSLVCFGVLTYSCFALFTKTLTAAAFSTIAIASMAIVPLAYALPFIQRFRLGGVELERLAAPESAITFAQMELPHALDTLLTATLHLEWQEPEFAGRFYPRFV